MKLTPFSNKAAVQPIPLDTRPNISGNINTTLPKAEFNSNNATNQPIPMEVFDEPTLTDSQATTQNNNTETSGGFSLLILISLMLILILVAKKLMDKKIKEMENGKN